MVGELTFARKLGFLEKGSDVDGMMAAIEGMLLYASQIGQVPEMHWWLLGNPLFTALMPAMETWNQVVMFTLKAVNSRTKMSRDGELEVEDGSVGNDMLSKWAAVKAFDPLKMSTRDVIVHLSTNVSLTSVSYPSQILNSRSILLQITGRMGSTKLSEY